MKKVMFALAIAGMFSFAACNNNNEAEAVEDTVIEAVEEIVEDTMAVEGMAEEAVEAVENAEAVAEN